jgi:hypothetical protein
LAVDLTLHALDLGAWDIGIAAIDTTDAGALVDVQAICSRINSPQCGQRITAK